MKHTVKIHEKPNVFDDVQYVTLEEETTDSAIEHCEDDDIVMDSPVMKKLKTTINGVEEEINKVQCGVCDKHFEAERKLKEHMSSQHKPENEIIEELTYRE